MYQYEPYYTFTVPITALWFFFGLALGLIIGKATRRKDNANARSTSSL